MRVERKDKFSLYIGRDFCPGGSYVLSFCFGLRRGVWAHRWEWRVP